MLFRGWNWLCTAVVGAVVGAVSFAAAGVIESWENPTDPTFDGWTIPTSENPGFQAQYGSTIGVTDGLSNLVISPTTANLPPPTAVPNTTYSPAPGTNQVVFPDGTRLAPGYGQMFRSPFRQSFTTQLAHAATVAFDINVPNPGPDFSVGAFGYFLQFDVVFNNADLLPPYHSLDNFSFPVAANIGGQRTLTFNIPFDDVRAKLATSTNPTQIILQVGGGYTAPYDSAGNLKQFAETFYIDNLQLIYKPGDFNFDGHVDGSDIQPMIKALTDLNAFKTVNSLSNSDLVTIGDYDQDQKFTNADLQGWIGVLLGGGGGVSSVPEPASFILLGFAMPGLALLAVRRRNRSAV